MAVSQTSLPENLTVPEAATWLRISERTAWNLIRDDELPSFKAGAQVRVNLDSLREWAKQNERSK